MLQIHVQAAEVLQRSDMAFDPIGRPLMQARYRDGVARGPRHRDEHLRPTDFTGPGIDQRDRLTRVIGLHHRAGGMPVPIGLTGALLVRAKLVTEPGVAKAIGMSLPAFLP